jgi:hypothetical protein
VSEIKKNTPRKLRYKPPVIFLIIGILFLLSFVSHASRIRFDVLDSYNVWTDVLTLVLYFVLSLLLTGNFIRQSLYGYIELTHERVEFPNFFGKPDKVNLADIRFVTETNPGDGLVKVSTAAGFFRFQKKIYAC